jgi:phospho-N-acetylmuramoyl-pentapeptide-transferase
VAAKLTGVCKKIKAEDISVDRILIMMLISFAIAVILGFIIIPFLRALKAGQSIRQIGPQWHNSKAGTPTIGGVIFIFAILISTLIVGLTIGWETFDIRFWGIMICSILFGFIGFIDDFIKVVLKRNLGLRARHKFLLQLMVAIGFSAWIVMADVISTDVLIPFTQRAFDGGFTELTLPLGIMFIPFTVFVLIGVTNSVNLTDGLDGLATSVTSIVCGLFLALSHFTSIDFGTKLFLAFLIGGLLGFLLFNKYPAKVFMGDTGSLFLGGAVASVAIIMQMPLFLIIVGFVYLAETLSVIIQVISFKTIGKRVFKMSPLHHHFEMSGWSERKVVAIFSFVTLILCVIMWLSVWRIS